MALTKIGKEGITGISNSSDANVITIDSSERVGINTNDMNSYYSKNLVLSVPDAEGGITIVSPTTSGSYLMFADGTTGDERYRGYVEYSHTSDYLGFATSGTLRMKIDSVGHVTNPYQSAFSASLGSIQTNPANASRVAFNSEIFDQNADYDTSIYVFTAPVTGKYFLSFSIRIDAPDSAADYVRFNLNTSNRGYNSSIFDLGNLSGDPNYWNMQTAVLADMDAGDTAEVEFVFAGGAQQTDISTESYFTGCLVC